MHFVIADSEGAVLDTFGDERLARFALLRMAQGYPAEAADLFLLPYGDDGQPDGNAVSGAQLAREIVTHFQGGQHKLVGTTTCFVGSNQRKVSRNIYRKIIYEDKLSVSAEQAAAV